MPEHLPPVPMEKWGKDHWSTLAYAETRVVDHAGVLDNRHMRCNARLHRELANVSAMSGIIDGGAYPTRLRDGTTIAPHDDWSCLEDAETAGLITSTSRIIQRRKGRAFGFAEAVIKLTPLGIGVCAALRAHKANGGTFAAFTFPKETI